MLFRSSLSLNNGATAVSGLSYGYGDGMNLTAINDNVTPANTIGLSYTAANGLQYAGGSWGQSNYYYDILGNRTYDNNTVASVLTSKVTSYDSISNHMISTFNGATQLRSYAYDGAGNITNDNRPGQALVFTCNNRNMIDWKFQWFTL